jgi:hypothetical protein
MAVEILPKDRRRAPMVGDRDPWASDQRLRRGGGGWGRGEQALATFVIPERRA